MATLQYLDLKFSEVLFGHHKEADHLIAIFILAVRTKLAAHYQAQLPSWLLLISLLSSWDRIYTEQT